MHACMYAWHRHAWSVRDNTTEAPPPREKGRTPRPCQKGPHRCWKQISEEIADRTAASEARAGVIAALVIAAWHAAREHT